MTIKSFKNSIFAWDEYENKFYKVINSKNLRINDLHYITKQKEVLLKNTILFVEGKLSNNALLWGARGTGKSSLVLAVFNEVLKNYNVALLEIKRNQIKYLSSILRRLNNFDEKFIIFCDDFSFKKSNKDFIYFKNVLDGSVSKSNNLIYYITSNFRNVIKSDQINQNMNLLLRQEIIDDETALSDRFGLWLGFERFTDEQYLSIVKSYINKYKINITVSLLQEKALQWSLFRGSKSGREAYNFAKSLLNEKM